MLRNEVASRIAREAGFRVVTPARGAAVFLNGEYYGFAWLLVSVNAQYLQDIYNAPTRDFDIVGDGESWVNTEDERVREAIYELNRFAELDLTRDHHFRQLSALVDIDNLLFYYAYEMYMGNWDWPHNNLKRWRYTGPRYDNMPPELDGRWRYIMYDLDWTLGLYGDTYDLETFEDVLGGERNSPMLSALLRRTDMQRKFAGIICDIAANAANAGNVTRHINELFDEAEHEIKQAFAARKIASWVSMDWVRQNHREMMDFARSRSWKAFSFLSERYGLNDMFDIEIINGTGMLNTLPGTRARYFTALTVPVSPLPPPHHVFDHWLVNGQPFYEPQLYITAEDAINRRVELELITREELPPLLFTHAYSDRGGNGCWLINPTALTVSTRGLYLSDSLDNPYFWALPDILVESGETLQLAGRGSTDPADLLKVQIPFRVQSGAVLLLSDGEGNLLDRAAVP
jgi:hypothetical protein